MNWLTRISGKRSTVDGPERLLIAAVRMLPKERRDWAVAMLAELAYLQSSSTRWRFALGCTRVALFPPQNGGSFQNIMNHPMKSTLTNLGLAAFLSALMVLPFAILEFANNIVTRQSVPGLIVLFGLLFLLPMTFIVILGPIVRTVRTGNSVLANPFTLLFRLVLLALCAAIWGAIIIDQLPCFLGVPNCD